MSGMQILVIIAVGLVTLVLAFGLYNLMRGGPPSLSQKLMRARILLQLIAVILLMGGLYLASRS